MTLSRIAALVAALALPALAAADSPFDGKTTTGWKPRDAAKSKWKVGVAGIDDKDPKKMVLKDGTGELVNTAGGGTDILTEARYGDCTVALEFMIPKGSNSGVYLMGEYEIQVYDTFDKKGKDAKPGDMAGIYTFAPPKVFADKGPGVWQKFVIDFRAPKFEGDKKVANAKFVKVTFNDQVIHEDVECKAVTPGGLTGKEAATGPLLFQGDHGPVAYRNIVVTSR